MSENRMSAALQDARALIETVEAHGWRQVHIMSGEIEIFLALDDGCDDPMQMPAPGTAVEDIREQTIVSAPHVATFIAPVTIGSTILAGTEVGRLRILDEELPIFAQISGRVARVLADNGALVEFDQPLLVMEAE